MAHYKTSEWAGPISETRLTLQAATVTGMQIISADYRSTHISRTQKPPSRSSKSWRFVTTTNKAEGRQALASCLSSRLPSWPHSRFPDGSPATRELGAPSGLNAAKEQRHQVRSRKRDEFDPLTSTNSQPLSKIPTKHYEKAHEMKQMQGFSLHQT